MSGSLGVTVGMSTVLVGHTGSLVGFEGALVGVVRSLVVSVSVGGSVAVLTGFKGSLAGVVDVFGGSVGILVGFIGGELVEGTGLDGTSRESVQTSVELRGSSEFMDTLPGLVETSVVFPESSGVTSGSLGVLEGVSLTGC
jgi:hypothetical protein